MSLQYSIIIPAFFAQNSIEKVTDAIKQFFSKNSFTYEIIIVDDASKDGTWEVLKKLKSANSAMKVIRLAKNFGQHSATLCGIRHSKGEFIVTIDDDLEVHPEEIIKLIAEQKQNNSDVVYGEYGKLNRSFFRSVITSIYKFFSKAEGRNKGKGSSFRLIKGDLARKIAESHFQFNFIDELILWYTDSVSFIRVAANEDYIRKGGYSFNNLFRITTNVIMFSSMQPLQLVTVIGFSLATINFLIGLFFILKKVVFRMQVHGYTSIIVSVLFSTGLIVLSIGIVAQYISKILKDVNKKPSYHIAEKIVND
jgi:polyisoprenyl-phosphate glycosyltransferase